jgi:Fur family transcriptional regulator, ferric uptake regulator
MKMIFNTVPPIAPETERVLASFRAKGLRLTGPRRAIIECLGSTKDWLTPASVHEQASRHRPSLGLVTVYRTLNWLHQQGLVRRIHRPDGCHGYALASLTHGHYLVCQRCQQVIEFSTCDLGDLEAQITSETGFTVQGHMLQFVGVCPSCQSHESG